MYLRKFFAAWYSDWTGRMSGSLSIALTFWATFFPPNADKARLMLLTAAIISFILGSYHVWAKAHEARNQELEKNTYPEITGEVEEAHVYTRTTQKSLMITFISLLVSLVNTRPAVTTIKRYKLKVLIGDKEYEARNIPFRDVALEQPEFDRYGLPMYGEKSTEEFKDLEEEKFVPRERGVIFRGWLRFALVDRLVLPQTPCQLVLIVVDAFGREHKLEAKPSWRPPGQFVHIIREERRSELPR
jgi:hypothetical protein